MVLVVVGLVTRFSFVCGAFCRQCRLISTVRRQRRVLHHLVLLVNQNLAELCRWTNEHSAKEEIIALVNAWLTLLRCGNGSRIKGTVLFFCTWRSTDSAGRVPNFCAAAKLGNNGGTDCAEFKRNVHESYMEQCSLNCDHLETFSIVISLSITSWNGMGNC